MKFDPRDFAISLLFTLLSLLSPRAQGAEARFVAFEASVVDEYTPELEPVTQDQFILAGKGISDRKHDYDLALACVGAAGPEACRILRFVFFGSDHQAYFVGQKMALSKIDAPAASSRTINDSKSLEKYLKKVHRAALRKHRTRLLAGSIVLFMSTWGLGAAGAIPFLAISEQTYLLGGFFVFPIAAGTVNMLPGLIDPFTVARNLSQGGTGGQQLTQQEGWNWSSEPTKVSPLYFREFVRAISPDGHAELVKSYRKLRETQW